ncbi:serine/arginine repetitive matrix protein 3-like [Melospiza melodia melodia]|uniref:serine/arginine repetitive matrix protein 3-like n=1 Tax=Melospiza melodia melodia TaxID=1914991 RepID=UPI002FD4EDD6
MDEAGKRSLLQQCAQPHAHARPSLCVLMPKAPLGEGGQSFPEKKTAGAVCAPGNALSSRAPGKCSQAGCPSLPAGQPGTLLRLSGRGNGAGTPADPHAPPALPGHRIPLRKPHLCVLAPSPCPAAFKGSPVLVPHFLGQAPGSPSSASRGGKTRRIWPTAAKRGARGSRGSSRGRETRRSPPFSPPRETSQCSRLVWPPWGFQ